MNVIQVKIILWMHTTLSPSVTDPVFEKRGIREDAHGFDISTGSCFQFFNPGAGYKNLLG